MKGKKLCALVLVFALLAVSGGTAGALPQAPAAEESISVIRQNCSGYDDCYTSLAAWAADYGGLPNGDLVSQDQIAVARIEGTWTQADTDDLTLSGWTTDAERYIRIYTTSEARHNGTPVGNHYRLVPSSGGLSIHTTHARVEGLEIHSLTTGTPVYARPGSGVDGDIRVSHNLIHGNGTTTGSGVYLYDYDGTARIWNNVIYDVGSPGYRGGIQTSRGTTYIYNNTIVDIVAGYAIRSGGVTVVKNNLAEAPTTSDDYYGSFYPGSDFNASSDDTAPGFHSRREQTFTFVNRAGDDFHLAAADEGARNYGTDLSGDAHISIADDVDGEARSGGWDIGADEATSGSDTVPPIRFDGAPGGTLPSDTTAVTLTLSTNEAANCRYATTDGVAYESMTETFSFTGGITHTHHVSGLVDEQTYTYHVRCQDTASNANDDDYAISFYVFSSDTTPPVISNVQVVDISPYSARITWDTDEPCTSQVEHGLTGAYGTISPISSTLVMSHSLTLVGLDPETTYHVRVRSQDVAYNETVSGDVAFTTATLGQFRYVNQNHASASDGNSGTTVDDPWETIQHAADVAQPGDTIIIYPGSYDDRVTINEGGTPGNYITFKGLNVPDQSLVDPDVLFDPENPELVPGNPEVNAVMRGFTLQPVYLITEPVSYVRIENLEITDISSAGYSGGSAILMRNTTHIEVVGNFIHDVNPEAHGVGIQGSGHDNIGNVIKGNTLYRVRGVGISIFGRDWLVEDNDISHGLDANPYTGVGGDTDAIRFFGSGHVIRNNTMYDYLDEEQVHDPHIDCFQTFSADPDGRQFAYDILVEGNTCENFGQMLMIQDQAEAEGRGNLVHHVTLRNNIFRGARAAAINGSCDYFTLVNNIVAESHYTAFVAGNSPYFTVLNNIFYNHGSGSQIIDEDAKVGTVWDYNLYYPDFTWPPKQPEFDQHSLFGVDPGFVDPANGDYRLRPDSPAIDMGFTLREFNYDIAHTTRPQIGGWDVGAYEAVPELALYGAPGDGAIYLDWIVNTTLPTTTTWHIDYTTTTASAPFTATDPLSTTRAYALTDHVTNYQWYTVTLHAMVDSTSFLSDTVRVMPTDKLVYLPLVMRED